MAYYFVSTITRRSENIIEMIGDYDNRRTPAEQLVYDEILIDFVLQLQLDFEDVKRVIDAMKFDPDQFLSFKRSI